MIAEIPTSTLMQTALHEAGHAVVAKSFDVEVYRLTIVPAKGFAGLCSHRTADDWFTESVICFAGMASMQLIGHCETWGCGGDLASVERWTDNDSRKMARAKTEAYSRVMRHKKAIHSVTDMLLQHRHIEYPCLPGILNQGMRGVDQTGNYCHQCGKRLQPLSTEALRIV